MRIGTYTFAEIGGHAGPEQRLADLVEEAVLAEQAGPEGALLVGDPGAVKTKLARQCELFGNDRFLAQMSVGPMPPERVLRSIELLGTEVAPAFATEAASRWAQNTTVVLPC